MVQRATPNWNPAAASCPSNIRTKSLVHALQWAIGLEWYLLVDDPWRVAMSTDHPNGGSFLAYPEIVEAADGPHVPAGKCLASLPEQVRNRCAWPICSENIRWKKSASLPAPGRLGFWA